MPDMDWEKSLHGARDDDGALCDGGAIVGRALREAGVRHLFAINGGHTFPILGALRGNGIMLVHMRHEQACAYAADAYARASGGVGVCCVTAGCGLTNAITGLAGAALTGSAVVCIAGQHPTGEDGIGSFQEAYGVELCGSFAKSTARVLDWERIGFDLRQAFRAARGAPQGVAMVEIPTNVLYHQDDPARQRRGAAGWDPATLRAQADPAAIEQALDALLAAERPLIAAGDGVFWSDAAAELRELAELLQIPTYARRAAQGALPETHPLAVRGPWKKPFTARADVVLAVGFRFWSGEHFGQAPTWNESATIVQIDATTSRIGWQVPAAVALLGDPRLVLRQLCDAARRRGAGAVGAAEWRGEVATARANFDRLLDERERGHRGRSPLHPDCLARALCATIAPDATVILDSFTMSGWVTQWLPARFAGQVIDAGPLAPVGHGIGMAIGAQLARPGKQVVVVIGDGGLGIGGWDIETALRYRLPIHTVLWNNSSWGPSFEEMPLLRGRTDPFSMLDGIRYDEMFRVMGCHAEHVTETDQIEPALRRALGAGVASVVNVVGDKRVGHPGLGGNLLGSTKV
ncbi:MAG TPA: thiamine pyrophosphate-binding protein [Candidatus Dormibacteraeota bacterium]|nr:thiamine pyrophosphate-binding protein [Candidatus Dormibacteraeota bacterium]